MSTPCILVHKLSPFGVLYKFLQPRETLPGGERCRMNMIDLVLLSDFSQEPAFVYKPRPQQQPPPVAKAPKKNKPSPLALAASSSQPAVPEQIVASDADDFIELRLDDLIFMILSTSPHPNFQEFSSKVSSGYNPCASSELTCNQLVDPASISELSPIALTNFKRIESMPVSFTAAFAMVKKQFFVCAKPIVVGAVYFHERSMFLTHLISLGGNIPNILASNEVRSKRALVNDQLYIPLPCELLSELLPTITHATREAYMINLGNFV
jgi:hypothetical protein